MEVNFSKNSWHYRFYRAAYGSHPPQSLCPYFWAIVWAIIVLPFTFVGYWGVGRYTYHYIDGLGGKI